MFETKLKDYKAGLELLKELQETVTEHLEITKKYIASSAQMSKMIASYFRQSEEKVQRRTRRFAQLYAEFERIQLKSMNLLYEEELIQPFEMLRV